MGNHVFICYARKDQSFVLRLAAKLKVRGVPVWLDQWDIPPGADWDQSIDSALHNCAQFLIVLSPAAVASKHVRGELQTATDENKPIVPVLRQACQIPRLLRLIQYIDFTGCSPEDTVALNRLGRIMGIPDDLGLEKQPLTHTVSHLWLYGTVGGILVLGLLILGFMLSLSPQPKPRPPSPVQMDKTRNAFVRIDSQPSGCNVYQDGRDIDRTTPWQFDAPIGSYVKAVLKCKGHKDEKVELQVSELGNEYTYTPLREKSSGR